MKLRTTTPASKSFHARIALIFVSVILLIATPIGLTGNASADQYDEKIKALQADIEVYNAESAKLSEQAKTLQSAVAVLQSQANAIQAQINISQAKYDQLVIKIAETEQKIKDNQDALGTTIANMYVDDEISPLELLAGSRNIGEYMDRQEYRASVRDELTSTISEVKTLKVELEKQKVDAGRVLDDQKNQKSALVAKQSEQQSLLNETKGKESAYQSLVAKSTSDISRLRAQQQAEIEAALRRSGSTGAPVAGDPNKGGYPAQYANAPYYAYIPDMWGMYARQCVSYTAWKVYQKNGYMPYWGGHGNANQWPGNAVAAGIQTSSTPRARSVGVITSGAYGHVVWVESINDNGTINISQYNYYNAGGSGWGHYSEMYNVHPSAYNVYIYF